MPIPSQDQPSAWGDPRLAPERPREEASLCVVSVPVANLRNAPCDADAISFDADPLQETQLLFGELVEMIRECESYREVRALEQSTLTAEGRTPYVGWVRADAFLPVSKPLCPDAVVSALSAHIREKPLAESEPLFTVSMGTRFRRGGTRGAFSEVALPSGATGWIESSLLASPREASRATGLRERLVQTSQEFLGMRYLWGGRSVHMPALPLPVTGVDCSGFVSLVYRAQGLFLCRNARDQWAECEPLALEAALPGDLLFLSRANQPTNIRHVMMVLDGERLIEAPGTGERVRIATYEEKFGMSLGDLLRARCLVEEETLHAGRPRGVFVEESPA